MYFESDDFELYYEKIGEGSKTILILPGWGETRNTFFKLINYFKEKYTIYIVDYPGFGNSSFPNRDLDIYGYSLIIKDFMIKENIINPIIIAHSFGGRIATVLTSVFNIRIDKMIFMDVAGIKPRKNLRNLIREKIYKLKKKLIEIICKKNKEAFLENLRLKYGSADYKCLPKNMLSSFRNIINEDLRKYYNEIKSEVLIIWGAKDQDTPLKDGKYICKNIENSALIVFPEGGHFTYLDYNNEICLIIDSFVKDDYII